MAVSGVIDHLVIDLAASERDPLEPRSLAAGFARIEARFRADTGPPAAAH
jgi:hypothetical protein